MKLHTRYYQPGIAKCLLPILLFCAASASADTLDGDDELDGQPAAAKPEAPKGFFQRLSKAYLDDWKGSPSSTTTGNAPSTGPSTATPTDTPAAPTPAFAAILRRWTRPRILSPFGLMAALSQSGNPGRRQDR